MNAADRAGVKVAVLPLTWLLLFLICFSMHSVGQQERAFCCWFQVPQGLL